MSVIVRFAMQKKGDKVSGRLPEAFIFWSLGSHGVQKSGARYVLNDASCGKYFDFGVVDGACDCVPKEQTNCKEADAENYHVHLSLQTWTFS